MAMLLFTPACSGRHGCRKLEDVGRPAVAGTALSGIKVCLSGDEQEFGLPPAGADPRAPDFLVFWHPFCISKAKLMACSMCINSPAFERDSRVGARSKDSPRPSWAPRGFNNAECDR
jgi:hypothetical protein